MLEMFHLVIAVFLVIGGYVIPNKYIPIYLLCTPYLVIDWNDTDGSCWLTKLRNMVKYKSLDPKIKDKIETLAEIMQKSGFYTSCDIIDDSVVPNQGFDEYNIYDENTVDFQQRHMEFIQRLSKKDKFFLFLHNTETHKKFVRDIIKFFGKNNKENYLK